MTRDDLLIAMARVASNHYLGVVFFDEIQDLNEAKSGGANQMLNFFVQLENVLGIPFGLIGTPKARLLFAGEFRQARRVSEQGDFFWHPMKETQDIDDPEAPAKADLEWETFVRAIWKYWYLRKDHPLPSDILTDEAVRTLYECSKGIAAVVVTVFFLAQRRAITSEKEDITKAIINSSVKDCQYFISRIFDTLREGQAGTGKQRALSDIDSSEWKKPIPKSTARSSRSKNQSKLSNETDKIDSNANSKPGAAAKKRKVVKRKVTEYESADFRGLLEQLSGSKGSKAAPVRAFARPDEFG
jgi:hypothetical protein